MSSVRLPKADRHHWLGNKPNERDLCHDKFIVTKVFFIIRSYKIKGAQDYDFDGILTIMLVAIGGVPGGGIELPEWLIYYSL